MSNLLFRICARAHSTVLFRFRVTVHFVVSSPSGNGTDLYSILTEAFNKTMSDLSVVPDSLKFPGMQITHAAFIDRNVCFSRETRKTFHA